MLQYATVFLIIALVAGIFGIGAIAAGAAEMAEFLLLVSVVLVVGGIVSALRHREGQWVEESLDPEGNGEDTVIRAGRHE